MQRGSYRFILACLSLLLLGQSLLPLGALAEISVRCKGASSAPAAPCVQATLMAADAAGIAKQLACCAAMGGNSTHRAAISGSRCLVSISLFDTKPATLAPQMHQWLLGSAPALAPPAIRPALAASLIHAVGFSPASFDLLPRAAVRSHGLRGPPCA